MYSNYLVLGFRNAKLFRNRRDSSCKDYVVDPSSEGGRRKRMDKAKGMFTEQFVEPITVYQISNMIHVLFNERPVPTHRKCGYPKVDYLFEKAKDSYLKYVDCVGNDGVVKTYNSNKDVDEFTTETITISKAVWNSWNPSPQINWDVINRYLGSKENVDWFFGEVIDLLTVNPLSHDVEIVRLSLLTKDLTNLFNGLTEIKRRGLVDYIKTGKGSSITGGNDRVSLTVNSSIDKVTILNGEILVPVNDSDIERLMGSMGSATILDGGYVWIDSIKRSEELSIDGFTKVGDIPTEKY
jgi:hypothetical protein